MKPSLREVELQRCWSSGGGWGGLGRVGWVRRGRMSMPVPPGPRWRRPSRRPGPRHCGKGCRWHGGGKPPWLGRAGWVAAMRACGCAERCQRARAGRAPASAGTRDRGMARQGNHHCTGECGSPRANPEHCAPSMPGQHPRPPGVGLVTADATHKPPAAGWLLALLSDRR